MKTLLTAVLVLLAPSVATAQQGRLPVWVSHTGKDQVGSHFVETFNRELSHSTVYEPGGAGLKGPQFYAEFISIDPSEGGSERDHRSIVSVVIEEMGFPNGYPVEVMWYHKVIVVNRQTADETAKALLQDMDARWCQYNKNSIGGCPAEKFEPRIQ